MTDRLDPTTVPSSATTLSISSRGLISISGSLHTDTFTELTGRDAGAVVATCIGPGWAEYQKRRGKAFEARTAEDLYYPFGNGASWTLAKLFFQYHSSKTYIDAYLKSVDIKANQKDKVIFRTADHYRQLAELDIQWGIHNDGWRVDDLCVPSEISGADDFRYEIYYRDIVEVIRFLLGHRPFKDNLAYAPVKIKNDNDRNVYNEMHTGEWWWETQLQIPVGGTVVPIIISSDETVMTQHHGDLSLWPVYVTIGNLDVITRKAQTRPSLVLLGLLPRVKNGKEIGDHIRSEVYHLAIGRILQRMYDRNS